MDAREVVVAADDDEDGGNMDGNVIEVAVAVVRPASFMMMRRAGVACGRAYRGESGQGDLCGDVLRCRDGGRMVKAEKGRGGKGIPLKGGTAV